MPEPLPKLPKPPIAPDPARFIERPFDDLALRDYCLAIREAFGYVRFHGLPVGRDPGRAVPLSRIYVEPRLAEEPIAPEEMVKGAKLPETSTVLAALRRHQRLVVLGDPGAGKSTLIHWLADTFTSAEPHPLVTAFGRLIPLPFILRDLPLGKVGSWNDLLATLLEQPFAAALKRAGRAKIERLLETGQALMLLDGLDEVGGVLRGPLRKAVWEGYERYPRCRWVLTSRVVGYDDCPYNFPDQWSSFERLSSLGDLHYDDEWKHPLPYVVERGVGLGLRFYTTPFNDPQIADFAQKWYGHYEPDRQKAAKEAGDFVVALQTNAGTQALGRIPNLLTLMALIYRQYVWLPDGRAVLYAKISEAYLESIDQARKLKFDDSSPLSRLQKERWLGEIAFELQLRREAEMAKGHDKRDAEAGFYFTEPELRDRLKVFVRENTALSDTAAIKTEADRLLKSIAERSGLLLPRGKSGDSDRYAFLHLSFQEYYAALHLRRHILAPGWETRDKGQTGPKALVKRAGNSMWSETFTLLFESLAEQEGWADHLVDLLFEDVFAPIAADREKNDQFGWNPARDAAVSLAISVSLDLHSGLSTAGRRGIWEQAWLAQGLGGTSTLPRLLRQTDYREAILAEGRRLLAAVAFHRLNLYKCAGDLDISSLLVFPAVEEVYLSGGQLSDSVWENLLSLPHLRELAVVDAEAGQLPPLRKLTRLVSLVVYRANAQQIVFDPALLAPLVHLESLHLNLVSGLSGSGFLRPLRSLKSLDLRACDLGPDLEGMGDLPNLETCTLYSMDVLNLSPLLHCPKLKSLTLYGSKPKNPQVLQQLKAKGVEVDGDR